MEYIHLFNTHKFKYISIIFLSKCNDIERVIIKRTLLLVNAQGKVAFCISSSPPTLSNLIPKPHYIKVISTLIFVFLTFSIVYSNTLLICMDIISSESYLDVVFLKVFLTIMGKL